MSADLRFRGQSPVALCRACSNLFEHLASPECEYRLVFRLNIYSSKIIIICASNKHLSRNERYDQTKCNLV